MQRSDRGFTFIELLVVIAIISILLGIALVNFQYFSYKSLDSTALSDYRNIKVALLDSLSQQETPNRFVMNRLRGPRSLPTPLEAVHISEGVEATVFYDSRRRRNSRPRTISRIQIYHLDGSKGYYFSEVNGVITEQVRDR